MTLQSPSPSSSSGNKSDETLKSSSNSKKDEVTTSTGYSHLIQMDYEDRTRTNDPNSMPMTSAHAFKPSSSQYNHTTLTQTGSDSKNSSFSTSTFPKLDSFQTPMSSPKKSELNHDSPKIIVSNEPPNHSSAELNFIAHATNGCTKAEEPQAIDKDLYPKENLSTKPTSKSSNLSEEFPDNHSENNNSSSRSSISIMPEDSPLTSATAQSNHEQTLPYFGHEEEGEPSNQSKSHEFKKSDMPPYRHSFDASLPLSSHGVNLENQTNTRPKGLERSHSVVSLKGLNVKVDQFVKDIRDKFHRYKRWRQQRMLLGQPRPNEIYYSVFKPPLTLPRTFNLKIEDLQEGRDGYSNPQEQATQEQFDAIVDDVVDAIENYKIQPKLISQGSSGSYFVYNTAGTVVGVFKPKDEEPYGPLSPKWTKWLHRNLFPCFFGRSCLIPNNGYIAECAASLLDRQLGTHIVPFTDIVYLSSPSFYYRFFERRNYYLKGKPLSNKPGSFQLFLHDYIQADTFLREHPLDNTRPSLRSRSNTTNGTESDHPRFEWTPAVINQFREEIEKLVILDYIMRNTDRGLDNWMVKVEWKEITIQDIPDESTSNGQQDPTPKTRKKIVPHIKVGAIDSGLAFPWKHPDEWRSYPFGWLFLPMILIGQPFSQRTRDHFLPLLTSAEWWEETAICFYNLFSQDSDFNERMFRRQWAVLKGQAFNVVETLKDPEQGPLDLVRRPRVMVWDDEMDVPVNVPSDNMRHAMSTPLWATHTNAATAYRPMEAPSMTGSSPRRTGKYSGSGPRRHSYDSHRKSEEFLGSTPASDRLKPAAILERDPTMESLIEQASTATNNYKAAANHNKNAAVASPSKRGKRARGSSLSLEAKYRELETLQQKFNKSNHPSSNITASGGQALAPSSSNGSATRYESPSSSSGKHDAKPTFEDLIRESPTSSPKSGSRKVEITISSAADNEVSPSKNNNNKGSSSTTAPTGDSSSSNNRGKKSSGLKVPEFSEPYHDDEDAEQEERDDTLGVGIGGFSYDDDIYSAMTTSASSHNMGFSVAENYSQASKKVIVERLQTVKSRPPVFTWC